jgi:hypothetical protein
MKENIYLVIKKKNNILNFSMETEHFISDLLNNIYNEKEYEYNKKIININYIYNYILNVFLKYKFYLIFIIVLFFILKKIILYFLYINNAK